MLSKLRARLLATDRGLAVDLLLVFVAAFGIRLCWAALTPPWLSPDEPAHFSYVAHLVENGEIPQPEVYDERYPLLSPEYRRSCELTLCWKISGLGSGFGKLKGFPLEYDYAKARAHRLDGELRKTSSGSSASEYPPLYYAVASLPYRLLYDHPILDRALGVRALSAWLSALACVFAYLFSFEIYKSRLWGRAVALCLAFMPMHAFIGASINNDAAMLVGTAALWWLVARAWFAIELRPTSAFILGVVAGLSMLGKPTSAPLVVPAALVVVGKALRGPDGWRFRLRAAIPIATFGLGLALTEGPWILYRATHTRHPTAAVGPSRPGALQLLLGHGKYSLVDYAQELHARSSSYFNWLFVKTYWATFGWLEIFLSDTLYTAIDLVIAAATVGLVVRLWKRPIQRAVLLGLLGAVLFNAAALMFAADYLMAFAMRGSSYGMQGRYFFGTVVPFMLLLLTGLCGLLGERPWVLRAAPLLVVLVHVVSMLTVLQEYYGVSIG